MKETKQNRTSKKNDILFYLIFSILKQHDIQFYYI